MKSINSPTHQVLLTGIRAIPNKQIKKKVYRALSCMTFRKNNLINKFF